jgi:hypothetical protein
MDITEAFRSDCKNEFNRSSLLQMTSKIDRLMNNRAYYSRCQKQCSFAYDFGNHSVLVVTRIHESLQ